MDDYQEKSLKRYWNEVLFFLMFVISIGTQGQDSLGKTVDATSAIKTVVAGKQYKTSAFHQWLWGKHYRREWATPVKVLTLNLDTINGGLTAYAAGGGRQSKTLRLKNPAGKEYVLRSIDKTFGKALPEIYQNTFIEKIINDQVSIAQPYSAVTIPALAKAAQIFHSEPIIVFIPEQKGLGQFNNEFANHLYLLEQRADGDWSEAGNFGNSIDIVSTDKMLKKIFKKNDHRIDQRSFIKARLFDMFIGDWGRHEDQWRWAIFEADGEKIYRAVPRDRDQVFTKFDGVLLSMVKGAAGADHLQTFGPTIRNIGLYNFPARNLDRQAANETTREQWIATAKELQQLLTTEIIETSVKQLPPEVFPISGDEIIAKLKSRREHLVDFATDYYSFLAKEVEITGTQKKELFKINRISDEETMVNIYDLDEDGNPKKNPFYSRTFLSNETQEIRLYGIGNNDQYEISGQTNKGVKIKIIGGAGRDMYSDSLLIKKGKNRIRIYDNADNDFRTSPGTKLRLSESDSIHVYRREGFKYDKKGIKKIFFYNNEDRIHIGLGYEVKKHKWRTEPFAYKQEVNVKYSLMENALSTEYKGIFTDAIGKWNLALYGGYDWIRWINYFGIGNNTERTRVEREDRDYYRMRTRQFLADAGLNRTFGSHHFVNISGFFHTYDIVEDIDRFVAEHPTGTNGEDYYRKDFAGAHLDYRFQDVNNPVLPTKGIRFLSSIEYTDNVHEQNKYVVRYSSAVTLYTPLSRSFVWFLKTGAATLSGKPEFYQLNRIGGGQTLRGYRRFRFYGKSVFYAQNELQWIRTVRGNLFNGKAGLLGLVDVGRVWQPGENSKKMHLSFGGGFILAPFNQISVAATYAASKEDATVNFRFGIKL